CTGGRSTGAGTRSGGSSWRSPRAPGRGWPAVLDRIAGFADRRARRIVIGGVLVAIAAGAIGAGVAKRLGPYHAKDPASANFKRSADETKPVDRLKHRFAHRRDVRLGGFAVASRAANSIVSADLAHAELLAFPLLFLLALWFFRSLVAAALPPLVGGLA